ncbi:MAG: hypothetical protein JF886_00885, partial [Candidatus Dormibacteraeota bacterium]|nr:hypothetical protein [Candidatus Dormibacteraeota bacterium]
MGDIRRPSTTLLGVACAALAVAMAMAAAALVAANGLNATTVSDVPLIVVSASYALLGALVASRQPRNITGWLFLFVAVFTGMGGVASEYALYARAARHGALPGAVWAIWFTSWSQYVLFPTGAIALLMLYLPDGRVPSPRWRPLAGAALVFGALGVISGMFAPGPLQVGNVPYAIPNNPIGPASGGPIALVLSALALAWVPGYFVFVAAAAAPVVRLRRSRGDVRQQLKWIAYAVAVSGIGVVLTSVASIFDPRLPTWISGLVLGVGFGVALPIATGVAVFKYRLYDIDIVISRTLVYGALAVFITAVYVGIAVGIGTLVGGGGKPNLALSIVATAIVAVGFQPVRERVQRIANRLVYGKRATPYEVLAQFSERVAESYATDDVMPRMARVLAEGTGAQRADVWLRGEAMWRNAAVWPLDALTAAPAPVVDGTLPALGASNRLVEVRHQGALLGALSITKRPGEALTPVEDNLL